MNVTIVGGGIIGASTAYFLSAKNVNVKVLERDPTYTEASFGRSCGGLRHQFLQEENILLGMYGSQFVRQFSKSVQFTANGYLMLFNEEQKAEQMTAVMNQGKCNAGSNTIDGSLIQSVFPWINPEGLAMATYTDTGIEGWIDPYSLHTEFKKQAIAQGAEFIKQDVKSLDEVKDDIIVVTAGCWTGELLSDIPIKPQKHTVFNIKCPTHMPDMPLTADFTTGIYWRPEGHGYIVGSPNGRFDQEDLEPDWNDFDEDVWIPMAMRAPMFEQLKMENAWAGYYDTNVLDNNAVVGKHPKMDNVYLASGFTGRGLMEAHGIGRGLMELITTGEYQSINLSCFDPTRVLNKEKRLEPYVI